MKYVNSVRNANPRQMAFKTAKINMDQLKINLKGNIPRSKGELSVENAWLQHLIYHVLLLSSIVRDSLVLHDTKFVPMIQSKHEYEEINELNLQVNTLEELVSDRLLRDSFLSWLINKINLQSENTYCLSYLEEYHGDQWNPNLLRRISRKCGSNLPERLILFLNVGKCHTETFIGEFYDKNNKRYCACHYSLFVYNFLSNQAYYCDSVGWNIPRQLTHPFGDLLFAITGRFLTPCVLLAHRGNSFQGKHKCLYQSCSALYPLQSCGNVCGVTVCAALAAFPFNSFELLLQPSIEENEEINNLRYLRNISDHSFILLATVMKWCNEIDVNDIFLIDQMASMQQHHSNESRAAICKQDSVIKNKLNQVSAKKTVNKKAVYLSRKYSLNSFERAPSKKQKLASKKTSSPGSANIPQKQEEECAKQQKQEQQKSPLSFNLNFKVDAKPEKKNIPKDRLHEAKKDINQGEFNKFDGHNLYFSSQADIPHHKTLLVSCNPTICSLEIPHFHCSLCNEESFTTLYQLKRHANQTHFNEKHCVF